MSMMNYCNSVSCNTLIKTKSDHYPIMLTINLVKMDLKCQFKFLKMWTLNDDCARMIKETWNTPIVGCHMFILNRKLRILKSILKEWNKNTFGNVHDNVKKDECYLRDI